MIRHTILFSLLFIVACHSNKHQVTKSMKASAIEKLANDRFDGNFFIVNNSSNTYSLVKSKTKKFSEIGFDINYMIFNTQTNELIVEGFLKSGFIDWVDAHTVKIVNRKIGKHNKRQKETYFYNVETRKRTEINN